ncbi:hypothetical protein B7P43_G05874 [Cryptotermes secundus]|uniref:G-protein coupled receptors family 2 profile 2 domain-containing protein n=1 Tax=Cryptotermes secundus TaxID=105785 RepID=A0A2J7R1B3_9NEOP|nr:hypothetical protein B7P43_G05874 [Cryptotermes secundus]
MLFGDQVRAGRPGIDYRKENKLFSSSLPSDQMKVLITKLRATNNAETQQYRKATKALLVLIPLLGITYILVITGPAEGIPAAIYDYVTAVLLSTQGFTIALFYCFLNTEVQNTVRHHFERWKTARSLGGNRRYNYSSKDWSPRSRTESIR